MAQSITLQTNDSIVENGDVLGRLNFAASNESSGGDALLVGASVYAIGEGEFTSTANPTSLIFSTANSESAESKLKINSLGHFLPVTNNTNNVGSSSFKFANIYATTGNFSDLKISGSIYDGANSTGASGQFLSSTGAATSWIDGFSLPPSGLEGQILYKVTDNSDELAWIDNYATEVREIVKNDTGSGLLKGTVVMATGAVGDRIQVAPAVADGSVEARYMFGVLSEDIDNGQEGYATLVGPLKGISTIGLPLGTVLWIDPDNPGGLTSTQPSSPNLQMSVAIVTNGNANNGRIFVRMWEQQPGLHELHDVNVDVGLASGDLIGYDSSNGTWRNIENPSGNLQSQITQNAGDIAAVSGIVNGTPSRVAFFGEDGNLTEDSSFTFNSGTDSLSFTTGRFSSLIPTWAGNSTTVPNIYHGGSTAMHIRSPGNGYGITIDGWAQRIILNGGINGVLVTNSFLSVSDVYRPTSVKLRVTGSIGQSANLQEWRNSSSSVLAYVDAAGNASFKDISVENLSVSGTFTYVNSSNVTIADKQLELGSQSGVAVSGDAFVDDGGIVLKSTDGDKQWIWKDATDSWYSSENIAINNGKYLIFGDATLQTTAYTGQDVALSGALQPQITQNADDIAVVSGLLSDYVPYSGATQDVDLGANTLTANNIVLGESGFLYGGINSIEQRNSLNPQEFYVYNTYSDSSNYERASVKWDNNVLRIGPEALGSGIKRNAIFDHGLGVIGTFSYNVGGGPQTHTVLTSSTGIFALANTTTPTQPQELRIYNSIGNNAEYAKLTWKQQSNVFVISSAKTSSSSFLRNINIDAPRVGFSTTSPEAQLHVVNDTASDVAVIVQGAAAQSANLQEWRNNNGDTLVDIASNGSFATSGSATIASGVILPDSIPVDTTETLYNNSGILYFDGSPINTDTDTTYTAGSGLTLVDTQFNVYGGSGHFVELNVEGPFTATTKSFLINHPLHTGMKLQYGSLEGPENGVYVRGTTSSKVIDLPDYWRELVDEQSITVTLTPLNEFQPLCVKHKDNRHIIVGGVAGEYDYVVYGERKDVSKLKVEWWA